MELLLLSFILATLSIVGASAAINGTTEISATSILSDANVLGYPDMRFGESMYEKELTCKSQPTDKTWPTKSRWDTLNLFSSGRLVKPAPIAAPCYQGKTNDTQECARIVALWYDSDLHDAHPSSIMSPLFTGLSCIPTADPSISNCTQGTYPEYVVNARSVRDVQAAVNFARNTNIRLVIKNTGHDFAGKASGKGSLRIRTHMLKDIQFVEEYVSRGYAGPAFRVGSGVQTREIYAAAH